MGAGVEPVSVKQLGIAHVLQQVGVLDARRAKRIGATAQRQHQFLKADPALRHDFLTTVIAQRCQRDGFFRCIKGRQLPQHEAEVIAPGQHRIGQPFLMCIKRASGDFVQSGFPDMKRKFVNQQHALTPLLLAQAPPQLRCQLQPACAAAHNHNVEMHRYHSSMNSLRHASWHAARKPIARAWAVAQLRPIPTQRQYAAVK